MMQENNKTEIADDMHEVFNRIRNYLVGRVIGITRDKSLLEEVVKCLFCYSHVLDTGNNIGAEATSESVSKLYRSAFTAIKEKIPHIFSNDEELLLDPESIKYVHNELSSIDFYNNEKDPLGELYQAFIGSDLRMTEGQFFTPHKAVTWIVSAIDPQLGEKIIDPACGPGGFLNQAAKHLAEKGAPKELINSSIFGIEKDSYLSKLAHAHLSLITLFKANIACADSIERKDENGKAVDFCQDGMFDIVLANPPFGAKIKSGTDAARMNFDLAHKWKVDKSTGQWVKENSLKTNTPPQILFIELCIKLLKPGGRMGIVVPESMISNSSTSYVVNYLRENMIVDAVAGMPENLFKTSGKGGTHTKTCLIIARKKVSSEVNVANTIFMAEAKWCGHDSRGNSIPHNDLPKILQNFKSKVVSDDHLGYFIDDKYVTDNILTPRYYDPEPIAAIKALEKTHDIVSFQELMDKGILSYSTGDEVGKLAYGTGDVPFIRTSDISNWEIKFDPKHCVSEETYNEYAKRQDVKAGDILMVRDGTYLIGTCAYVSKYDEKMLYQSHLYKIRTNKNDFISPQLLIAILSSAPVVRQIKSKRFTQDIIDTLGKRINELLLPIPKDKTIRNKIEEMVTRSIEDRIEARELAKKAKIGIIELL